MTPVSDKFKEVFLKIQKQYFLKKIDILLFADQILKAIAMEYRINPAKSPAVIQILKQDIFPAELKKACAELLTTGWNEVDWIELEQKPFKDFECPLMDDKFKNNPPNKEVASCFQFHDIIRNMFSSAMLNDKDGFKFGIARMEKLIDSYMFSEDSFGK